MRKIVSYFLFTTLILLVLGASTLVGFAQTDVETTPAEEDPQTGILADPDVFTLAELGYTESFMVGPYDVVDVFFSIPDSWELLPGTYLQLKLSYTVGGAGISRLEETNWVGGTLLVRFNNDQVHTVLLESQDPQTLTLVFPVESLEPESEDGRHHLRFFLDASMHCNYEELQTVVMIESDSFIKFVYDTKEPTNNLQLFPRPYYLPDSIVPAEVVIVLPDNPTALELEAGLAISAGLGSITNGESKVSLYHTSEMDQDLLTNNHLIFVGLSDHFTQFQNLELPVPVENGKFVLTDQVNENGVIQTVTSPWNSQKSILLVGGNTDQAVMKAAKALSTGKVIDSGSPGANLSLVDQVNTTEVTEQSIVDRTLADLNFETSTIGVYGDIYFEITFDATAEQAKSEGAYFEIISTRSNLLDFDRSGVMLILNDEVVGTIGYNATDSSVVTERIEFLPNFIRRGENRLEVISSLVPYDTCYSNDLETSWVTLSEDSVIHLPVSDQQIDIGERLDLDNYPQMFLGSRDLSDLAFVLPRGSFEAVRSASALAFYLGNMERVSLANFDVFYSDEITSEDLANNNLIFIGKATNIPQLEEIQAALPAQFKEGSDEVIQPKMPVNFSVLENTSVGYIELLESPWNPDYTLLMVMGNFEDGIGLAQTALTKELLINELIGNFSVVYSEQITSVDTRLQSDTGPLPGAPPMPGATEEPTAEPTVAPVTDPTTRPAWLVPTMLGVSILMVVLIAVALIRGSTRSRIN